MSNTHPENELTTIPDVATVRDSLDRIPEIDRKRKFLNRIQVALEKWCGRNSRQGWVIGGLQNSAVDLGKYIEDQLSLLTIQESIPRSVREGTLEFEPIRWRKSERQLVFLFEELLHRGFISKAWEKDMIWSKIAKMFVKKDGSTFDRKQLSNQKIQYLSNREGKPQGASDVESLLDQLKEIGSDDD